jgi:hypothetical protein
VNTLLKQVTPTAPALALYKESPRVFLLRTLRRSPHHLQAHHSTTLLPVHLQTPTAFSNLTQPPRISIEISAMDYQTMSMPRLPSLLPHLNLNFSAVPVVPSRHGKRTANFTSFHFTAANNLLLCVLVLNNSSRRKYRRLGCFRSFVRATKT